MRHTKYYLPDLMMITILFLSSVRGRGLLWTDIKSACLVLSSTWTSPTWILHLAYITDGNFMQKNLLTCFMGSPKFFRCRENKLQRGFENNKFIIIIFFFIIWITVERSNKNYRASAGTENTYGINKSV